MHQHPVQSEALKRNVWTFVSYDLGWSRQAVTKPLIQSLERLCASHRDSLVLIAATAADSDRTYYFAAASQHRERVQHR
jgi:hypothetical protein